MHDKINNSKCERRNGELEETTEVKKCITSRKRNST